MAMLWSTKPLDMVLRLSLWLLACQLLAYGHWLPTNENQRNTLVYLLVVFLCKAWLLRRLEVFPGGREPGYRLAVTTGIFACAFFVILALRLGYGRAALFYGMGLLLMMELVLSLLRQQMEVVRYVLVPPASLTIPLPSTVQLRTLEKTTSSPHEVLVVEPEATMEPEWMRFVVRQSASGRRVISRRQLQEKITGKVMASDLSVVELESLEPRWFLLYAKRLLDMVMVLLLLPLALPAGLLVALLVRLETPGSPLFRQKRVGRGNKVFSMYKFRSMHNKLQDQARFASDEKDRITRVGRFIRATHLDELPQLFNVLRGDMSLIGPRPEQPAFVAEFEKEIPFYRYRHQLRPGITGWAQVCQGYADDTESTREKLSYDLFYIKHLSLWLDILILARTLRSVLFDRHPEKAARGRTE